MLVAIMLAVPAIPAVSGNNVGGNPNGKSGK